MSLDRADRALQQGPGHRGRESEGSLSVPFRGFACLLAALLVLSACGRATLTSTPAPTLTPTTEAPTVTPTPALPGARSTIRYIYVVPMSHLDIGFTAPPDAVAEAYKANIDLAIRYLELFPDLSWTIEGVWQLEQWLQRTPDQAQIERVASLIKSGRLGLTAGYANLHGGLVSAAEWPRFLYPAEALSRRFGVRPVCAVQNDVPGLSWALPQVLAGAGVRYLVAGPNTAFGGGTSVPLQDNPFFWEGPDGSRVLTWVSPGAYVEGVETFRLSQPINEVHLEEDLARYVAAGYPYDAILVEHAMDNWDADQLGVVLMLHNIQEWNRTRANPKFVIATPEAFFEHMVEKYGDQFAIYRGDWSGLWEQVKVLSPSGTAMVREAKAALPAAEAIATLSSLLGDATYPGERVEALYRRLLDYDEHSVGSIVPWPGMFTQEQIDHDNDLRYRLAQEISRGSQALLQESIGLLSARLQGAEPGLVVFNPASWARTDLVSLPIPEGVACPCQVRDEATGEVSPAQGTADGQLLFIARDVPPLGYRRFRLEPAPAAQPTAQAMAGDRMANACFEVRVDRASGNLQISDLVAGRSLVAEGELPFNGLLRAGHQSTYGNGQYEVLPARPLSVTVTSGPVATSLTIERGDTPFVRTCITLYESLPWLEWTNILDRSRMRHVPAREHSDLYFFSLPLALGPQGLRLRIETAAGFMDPAADLLPGANGRGFSVQRVAALEEQDGYTALLGSRESFLVFAGGVLRAGPYPALQSGTLFAGAMGVAHEGQSKDKGVVPLQAGEPSAPNLHTFTYRLAAQAAGFDPAAAARFGWELHSPLLARYLPGQRGSNALPPAGSFLTLDAPNVVVAELKRAAFGSREDLILRLQETAGKPTRVAVRSAFPIHEAWVTSPTEEPRDEIAPEQPLLIDLAANAVITLRLRVDPASAPLAAQE
ncbi:MAG: hypothetical protein K6V36_05150 [Anaerolineae bacterium]|nr:hypothetical protein [Anaerolineae bacterium]